LRVLFLNRRDIRNPDGGGAEVYTHEIAAGLVRRYGCEVSVFACHFHSAPQEEVVDGVRYMRKGSEYTVHLWGLKYAIKNRRYYDVIVDEFNGTGFFTFFLSKSILLIHQMYREFWFREFGVAGTLPYLLEPLILRLYRRKPVVTVSPSTKDDLKKLGFMNIKIVMNATGQQPEDFPREKDEHLTLVFLGRLKSTKRPEDAIDIFKGVKKDIPSARLWFIGRGPEEQGLRKKAEGLNDVTFWGHVDGVKKIELLKGAHILVVPGVREGFGINVIEGAAAGLPAIGYNVHGLRDSIVHGETGFLVEGVLEAVKRIKELYGDGELYKKMSQNCLNYAKEFKWEKRVEDFWEVIEKIRQ
jgi:glycosyltransferase involved in cell wall biosynthesis